MLITEIIKYLKSNKEASIGEIYVKFHLMNKSRLYDDFTYKEITAKDIIGCIKNLYNDEIVDYKYVNDEKLYYIV